MRKRSLKLLTDDSVNIPAPMNVGQPVIESADVITVVGDVIHDVIVAKFSSPRVAAFDITPFSLRVVIDGISRPSVRFSDTRVKIDTGMPTCPEMWTLTGQTVGLVSDLHLCRTTS